MKTCVDCGLSISGSKTWCVRCSRLRHLTYLGTKKKPQIVIGLEFRSKRCRCGKRVVPDTPFCSEECRSASYDDIESRKHRAAFV